MARRVLTVDGKAVSAKQTLGLEAAKSNQEALTAMTALARDGASWNIGGIRRDINSPTIGLWFLTPAVAGRFRFTDAVLNTWRRRPGQPRVSCVPGISRNTCVPGRWRSCTILGPRMDRPRWQRAQDRARAPEGD
jgi:hypothetical protein